MPLNGWRGIAAYLGRNQSTVKRWAAARDLPVHRPRGSEARKGVPVYAFADELDAWIRGHPDDLMETAGPAPKTPEIVSDDIAVAESRQPNRRSIAFGVAAAAIVMSGGWLLAWRSPPDGPAPAPARSVQDEARALYVEATYLWQKRTPQTLTQATNLLKRALEIEPRFAAAEADLAVVYNLMVEYGVIDAGEGYELSRRSALRATALDPGNARGHSVLGDLQFFNDRYYEEGLETLRRAVKLDPADATSRHWLASALMARGLYSEASVEIRSARELEPLSRSIVVSQAMIALGQKRPAYSRQLLEQLINNEPGYRSPYRFLAFAELAMENYPAYLAALQRRFMLTDDDAGLRVVAAGERAWENSGPDAMVQAMIAAASEHRQSQKDPYFIAHWLALANAWGDAAEQLAHIPSRRFAYYGIDPAFAKARKDTLFRKRISDNGLPVIS